MVIADSNVWIHYLRTPDTHVGRALDRLLADDQVVMIGLVLAEILQGARDRSEVDRLRDWLEALPYEEATRQTWVRAAELSMALRERGQLIPLTDLVIAAVALEGDHEVFSLDQHFQRVPGLRLYRAVGMGGPPDA